MSIKSKTFNYDVKLMKFYHLLEFPMLLELVLYYLLQG